MNIFITGGSGFIGKPIVEKLKEDKTNKILALSRSTPKKSTANVSYLKGDLKDIKSWQNKLKKLKPKAAIHLAWEGIPDYGAQTSVKNLKYGLDLFNLLAEAGCKKIITAGSSWEQRLKSNQPPNAFVGAKDALHRLGWEIAKENDICFIWARLFYVYGPGQKSTSLIPYLIECAKKNKVPEIKNPSSRNDFVYVEDVAQAIVAILQKAKTSAEYEIGSGNLTSVQEIIKTVFNSYNLPYSYKKTQSNEKFSDLLAELSKINQEIGWRPKTSIKQGIKKIIIHQ